jgi:peroxiredoxin
VRQDICDVHGKRSPAAKTTSETTILELKVDEPLRDDLFQLEMKDGVQVADFRFDLPEAQPLRYTYKRGRTEAELQALHEAERKDLAKLRKGFEGLTAGVAARVGQRPPSFPETTWFNSKPLAWKDLEGKVVVLEFWADDCGASLGDFDVFGKDFKTFTAAGVTIIGVHTATTDPKGVEKAVESHKISIPVCIDAPGPEGKGFGAMTGWFGIDGVGGKRYPFLGGNGVIRLPYAVIVGKDGRVAAHGYLWEMLTKARELAAAAGGGEAPPASVEGKEANGLPVPVGEPPAAPAPRAR